MLAQLSITKIRSKLSLYIPLIKSLQTSLLLLTGVAGYLSAHTTVNWLHFWQMLPSLFFAIAGSTILNMWWDQDIDVKMKRTHKRPTSAGQVTREEVLKLGIIVSVIGIGWALMVNWFYGVVVFAGLFFDVVVYSMWLKRRTCWSIVWGGISGAMPILAGRVLAVGQIDAIGILLACAVLFWIPTHTLTFSLKFADDYNSAGVPTFPSTYGEAATRFAIAFSSVVAALTMGWASVWIGVTAGVLRVIIVLSAGLFFLAVTTVFRPSDRVNFSLFKYASMYMLFAMLLIIP
ncbi:heme o synthase [Candidatus Villigracilis affinis]|uniref:heme o synthase n=1 Tax=Candidatus Villigracilis affinis TaxID=3140682 RepID=UPI001D511990|nr:protoheme IX farnesyltransferase [Anaerolineales bacterium]